MSIFYAKDGGGGLSRLFVQIFLSHGTETFRWGTLRCIRKFHVSQNFMHKKGISLNSVVKFLSHSADKIRRRTLLCFERILVSKIFKQRRGEASGFCRNFFFSQDRKNFTREPFCFPENFWYRKKLWIRGGISRSSVEIFVSHSVEKFCKGILLFLRKFLVSKSFMHEKGGITFFRRKFLVSQCWKISWASLQCGTVN